VLGPLHFHEAGDLGVSGGGDFTVTALRPLPLPPMAPVTDLRLRRLILRPFFGQQLYKLVSLRFVSLFGDQLVELLDVLPVNEFLHGGSVRSAAGEVKAPNGMVTPNGE
jgi:hypothetical protein